MAEVMEQGEGQMRAPTPTVHHGNRFLPVQQIGDDRLDERNESVDLPEFCLHGRTHLPLLIFNPDGLQEIILAIQRKWIFFLPVVCCPGFTLGR